MTTVYGVTRWGAGKQIAKQLKVMSGFNLVNVDSGSKYLAAKTFESLNELFTSSQVIQDWLTQCAQVISADCGRNVEWVTPLGFPVVQPYTNEVNSRILHLTMNPDNMFSTVKGWKVRASNKVNTRKQKNGLPPNFIHSLDSCHMMLTALHLWPKGVTFASVHDCYWTHARDVVTMNKVCRDQFVALHSSPILEELSEGFQKRYSSNNNEIPEEGADEEACDIARVEQKKRELLFKNVPKKGDLDLKIVKDSVYFFS